MAYEGFPGGAMLSMLSLLSLNEMQYIGFPRTNHWSVLKSGITIDFRAFSDHRAFVS